MTTPERVNAISDRVEGVSKAKIDEILKTDTDIITEHLKNGERIPIIGLGAFELVRVEERKIVHPRTKEAIVTPAHNKPKFKISKTLKDAVR